MNSHMHSLHLTADWTDKWSPVGIEKYLHMKEMD